jgi:hypothetical protein
VEVCICGAMWRYEYECSYFWIWSYGGHMNIYTPRGPPPWVQTTPSRGGITAALLPLGSHEKTKRESKNRNKQKHNSVIKYLYVFFFV